MMKTTLIRELNDHLKQVILPYWKGLIDREKGGFYGFVDYDLKTVRNADKGVILHSRILYFFARAALVYGEDALMEYADHAYDFLTGNCLDKENGGVYWMMTADGRVQDSTKHTYNQAFAIYALAAYYEASDRREALDLALELFHLIEEKCVDPYGYREAFTVDFQPVENDKLSENGLLADKTMNTLLHLLEAYTLLYRVSRDEEVEERLKYILDLFYTKVWNPLEGRLEVFFDEKMNSLCDLYSYGHDIEASWLIDEAYLALNLPVPDEYTKNLAVNIYHTALKGDHVLNECFRGVVDRTRVWWVQAESMVGFVNLYQKNGAERYLAATWEIWEYIKQYFVDSRSGGEWFWDLDERNVPSSKKPITEPWKCPYHNGRMIMELFLRLSI